MNTKFRIWWIPQIPMDSFYVPVDSIQEGRKILEVLADYDIFQFEHNVKPDFSNAGGIQELTSGSSEWYDIEENEN